MNNKTITGNGISQASLVNYVNRVLNVGLDVNYRQVTVAMQEDGGRIKSAGKMGHVDFLNWVQKKLQEGWQILQLLRSPCQLLLVTPRAGEVRGQKPGGGPQGDGSRRQEAKD
jgi:hypothetical protein